MIHNNPIKLPGIALVICYYGKTPWYFPYFLKSCSFNSGVDFLIVTDIVMQVELPANCKIVNCSLADIKAKATEKFGFEVALDTPYKLCDYKPAYGLIFSEYLEGYDFWGHGDLDVIYGDIRGLLTEKVLAEYDFISVRPDYVSGFFALFRNIPALTNLFTRSRDFKLVFQDPANHCFDECNWHHNSLWQGKSIFAIRSEIQSMTYVIRKASISGDIKAYFSLLVKEWTPGKLEWNSGKLTFDNKEPVLLYHLIEFKGLPYSHVPKWKRIPDKFYIDVFYFSKFPIGSWQRSVTDVVLKLARAGTQTMNWLGHLVKWCYAFIISSKKMGPEDVGLCRELPGSYSSKGEDFSVDITAMQGCLYAKISTMEPILLRHKQKLRFLAQRFLIGNNVNVSMKFDFDPQKQAYILTVQPGGVAKIVLHQKTTRHLSASPYKTNEALIG